MIARHCLSVAAALVAALPALGWQVRAEEETASLAAYDRIITEDDRQHWAYLGVRKPDTPAVGDTLWCANAIDRFVLAALEAKKWRPAPAAPRQALLRRAYLDLVGFPPTPKQQRRFLEDRSPLAWPRVVEGLLANPGYGERWGRHWLDLVRYAETNGYERDADKPHVWRYRDYVISAFNDDKPYDRFVLEQLAGDELPDADSNTVIATGYYRLGPWDDEPADPKQDRFDQLDDIVSTTGQVFLGLTLGCTRCHNHKYEALTMHDYYRLAAVFDPLKRPRNGRSELDRPAGSRAAISQLAVRDREIDAMRGRIQKLRYASRKRYLASGRSKLPADAVAAFLADPPKRTARQNSLIKQHSKQLENELAAALPAEVKQQLTNYQKRIAALRRTTPDLPRGYFLWEASPRPPTMHLLLRGRAATPGPKVQPGMPAVLVGAQPRFLTPDRNTTRRRLTLARWIARSENPLTARVIVNRVWQYHFGEGLVRTPSDFGVMGASPTHPKLLEWLAHWFVHEGGWSLKRLHRLIMNSSTYRMSKRWNAEYARSDVENQLLWRFPYRRLSVEALRDSMLAVSGQLNRQMYGPGVYLYVPPAALEGHSDPHKIWKPLNESQASRRTVYAFVKRSLVVPMLEVLDLCDTTRSVEMRNVTSVAPQALTLFNGEFVNRQARHLAARLQREAGDDPQRQIARAFQLALCRRPTNGELRTMQEFLAEETRKLTAEPSQGKKRLSLADARSSALRQLCRVIFNLNEFAYTD